MVVAERRAVSAIAQIFAERRTRVVELEQRGRLSVEPHQVTDHAEETRRHEVPALAKHAGQARGVVFEAGGFVAHRETHGRRLRFDAELLEQPGQQGVVERAVHDEPGIDPISSPSQCDVVGMGVTAQVIVRLEQRDAVLARQQPGTHETGDSRTDDRNAHCFCSPDEKDPFYPYARTQGSDARPIDGDTPFRCSVRAACTQGQGRGPKKHPRPRGARLAATRRQDLG